MDVGILLVLLVMDLVVVTMVFIHVQVAIKIGLQPLLIQIKLY
jgi:hypothetical protein